MANFDDFRKNSRWNTISLIAARGEIYVGLVLLFLAAFGLALV